jgi:DNA-directed RNA polymerase specialized sigma24 family protein
MSARDEPFAAFVHAHRSTLLGTAALIHLDFERAGELLEAVLANLYASWPRLDDPYGSALRAVLRPGSDGIALNDHAVERFELLDVAARPPLTSDHVILTELAALSADERTVLVLASYTRVPLAQIAALMDRDVSEVIAVSRAATDRLQTMVRVHGCRRLSAELAEAAALTSAPAVADARPGRALLRRRRLRLVAASVAMLLAAGVGIGQAVPRKDSVPLTAPRVSVSPSPKPPCDVSNQRCRVALISKWRSDMDYLISLYLDPNGTYFTGHSHFYSAAYWDGAGGAFGLNLYRARGGATEVFLEIATSRQDAIRCGQLTGRVCRGERFMDGNRYTLTDDLTTRTPGMEAQHRPAGTYVITIVVRNTSKAGRKLPVTRGDLIRLISDPRLKLPPR